MRAHGSAFVGGKVALPPAGWGLLGVLAFSGTLPATRAALPAFGPVTVGLGRAVGVVVLGVVVGFPVLSAFALRVVGAGSLRPADVLLLAAVIAGAIGYAEGAVLARQMGGWQVICWALLASLPVLVPVCAVGLVTRPPHPAGVSPWVGFGHVSVVSMFLGFFAWYHGLARGGVARVGQLQLIQPVLTLVWASALLDEHVSLPTALTAIGALVFTALTQRARSHRSTSPVTEAVPR